jgi:hypothetical protein
MQAETGNLIAQFETIHDALRGRVEAVKKSFLELGKTPAAHRAIQPVKNRKRQNDFSVFRVFIIAAKKIRKAPDKGDPLLQAHINASLRAATHFTQDAIANPMLVPPFHRIDLHPIHLHAEMQMVAAGQARRARFA